MPQLLNVTNLLADAGLGKKSIVAFTEMRHNFRELPGLLNLLHSIGISRLISGTLVTKGRATLTNALHPHCRRSIGCF